MGGKNSKRDVTPRSGTRIIRDADTGVFVEAARTYSSSNSTSKEVAKGKLRELGIVDRHGKLTKNYS